MHILMAFRDGYAASYFNKTSDNPYDEVSQRQSHMEWNDGFYFNSQSMKIKGLTLEATAHTIMTSTTTHYLLGQCVYRRTFT